MAADARVMALARLMVEVEDQADRAARLGYLGQVATLVRYRDKIRDYRSALMRDEVVADMATCPDCKRLVDKAALQMGDRCPWCDETPLAGLDRRHLGRVRR